MGPDASRGEIASCLRGLSALIQQNLPRRVKAGTVFLPWSVTAPLLLARIARQGETLALLVEHGHEVDGEMVMRSMLEHLILFAWLGIEPDDGSADWCARNPEWNTEWWMVDQFRREKADTQNRLQHLPDRADPKMRAALRNVTNYLKTLPAYGEFPSVLKRAEEVDRHWSPRLDGWQTAGPGEAGFVVTFRGHYWTLYSRGSSSVHPDWGAIRRFLAEPPSGGYQRHHVSRERPDAEVNVFVSITAFLLGDALAVADATLGWTAYDEALRILKRWDHVRAPELLLRGAQTVLGARRRCYFRARGFLVRVELTRREFCVTVVDPAGGWWRLRHPLGGREWTVDADGGDLPDLALGVAATRALELLADATALGRKPKRWPADLP